MQNRDSWVLLILIASLLMFVAQVFTIELLNAVAFPVVFFAWMWLGAIRKKQIGSGYKKSLLVLFVIWLGGFLAMNLMDTSSMFEGTVLGFPPATAIMVYVVWFLPLIAGTLIYGLKFDSDYLGQEDIDKIEKIVGENININL